MSSSIFPLTGLHQVGTDGTRGGAGRGGQDQDPLPELNEVPAFYSILGIGRHGSVDVLGQGTETNEVGEGR